jgi:hypothetical protein
MPNRSELTPIARTKAAVAKTERWYRADASGTEPNDADGIWLVASLCIIGALLSIDFAAYFQVLDKLPMLVAQVP